MRHTDPRTGRQLVDLQERRTKLEDLLGSPQPAAPTAERLTDARNHIRDAQTRHRTAPVHPC